jgi:hypothetical protein
LRLEHIVLSLALVACSSSDPPRASSNDSGAGPPVELASPEVIAARLARYLWDADVADTWVVELLRGAPLSPDLVRNTAAKMIADPRARNGVTAFYRWWLSLDLLSTVAKVDPGGVLDADLRTSMAREAPALGAALTLDGPGTFADLLTSDFTYVDERLARHYGMAGVSGPAMQRMPYPHEHRRMGVIGGAGILTVFASLDNPSWPAKRGWLVVGPMLCGPFVTAFLQQPPPDPTRSIRQQMIDMTAPSPCMGCHGFLNPGGFAFTEFDSFGRWNVQPGAGPGETAGWLPENFVPDRPTYEDLPSLARLLAGREEVHRCFVRQWLQFAIDRKQLRALPPDTELSSFELAYAAFTASKLDLRELVLTIARTDALVRP